MDLVIQRFIDAMMAFPSLILALAIRATLGASLENVILAIAITVIAPTTRAIRSQALSIVPMDYVTAARAVGAGYWRIAISPCPPPVSIPEHDPGFGHSGRSDYHRELIELPGVGTAPLTCPPGVE